MDIAHPSAATVDYQPKFVFPDTASRPCTVPKCKYTVKSMVDFLEHEKEHSLSEERQHVCYRCHNSFSAKQALRVHLNSQYLRIGLYRCTCGRTYSDPSRKSRCLKYHAGQFCCPSSGCTYRNSRKELVARHIHSKHKGLEQLGVRNISFDTKRGRSSPPPEPEGATLQEATSELVAQLSAMEDVCRRYNLLRMEGLIDHFAFLDLEELAQAAHLHSLVLKNRLGQTSAHRRPNTDMKYTIVSTIHPMVTDAANDSTTFTETVPTFAEHAAALPSAYPVDLGDEPRLPLAMCRTSHALAGQPLPTDDAMAGGGQWQTGVTQSTFDGNPISRTETPNQLTVYQADGLPTQMAFPTVIPLPSADVSAEDLFHSFINVPGLPLNPPVTSMPALDPSPIGVPHIAWSNGVKQVDVLSALALQVDYLRYYDEHRT